jgi:hypothetical protein
MRRGGGSPQQKKPVLEVCDRNVLTLLHFGLPDVWTSVRLDAKLFAGGGDGVAGSVDAETKMAKVAVVAAIRADEANPVKEELSESFSSRSMDRQATAAGAVVSLRIEQCEIHGSGLSRHGENTVARNSPFVVQKCCFFLFSMLGASQLRSRTHSTGNGGAFNRSMQHHLGTNLFKGGVYDPTKTVETFSCGKDRHLAPMEVWAVPARDWARLWQATSHHSQDIVAMWRHSSRGSSPLAVVTHASGARRHLTRNRL